MPYCLSDEEVLNRVRAGDVESYEILIDRYQHRLYCLAMRILKNDAEAEDALQDAHLLALTRLDQFAGRSNFFTWIARITMNEALMRIRGNSRSARLETAACATGEYRFMAAPPRDPERQAFDVELGEALESTLGTMPEAYRAVFRMREMDEKSTAEAACLLGVTEECVKTRLHRARELLRRRLGPRLRGQRQEWTPVVAQPSACYGWGTV